MGVAHLDGGPGVDAVVVQAADGQHGEGKGVAQGAPAEHIDDVCRAIRQGAHMVRRPGESQIRPSLPLLFIKHSSFRSQAVALTEASRVLGAQGEGSGLLQVIEEGVAGGLGANLRVGKWMGR